MPRSANDGRMPDPPETTAQPAPGTIVAGYRLVRQIPDATGESSWLALADDPGAEPAVLTFCGDDGLAARRLAAHERVSSPHVLALLDLATDGRGRVLLATERTDWTLATLVTSRGTLAAGEAVTLLAPLAAGLSAVHAAGFVHGRLGPSTVLFTPDGRPVLGGLDGLVADAIQDDDGDGRSRLTAGAVADYRAFIGLLLLVADLVDEQFRAGFTDIGGWLDAVLSEEATPDALPAQLECRIFAQAPALPLVLVADRRRAESAGDVARVHRRNTAASPTGSRRATAGRQVARAIAAAPGRRGARPWLARVLRGRALAVCLAIVVAVVGVGVGLSAIPESDSYRDRPPRASKDAAPQASPPSSPAGDDTQPTSAESAAVAGTDAVAAVSALLSLRSRCAAVPAPRCVARFAEPGSALDAADRHAFAGGADGILLTGAGSAGRIEIVQEYGDAVLTRAVSDEEKRQPVLVLVVRTDTGWRLRDLFEPD